jgi:hypothetical protein
MRSSRESTRFIPGQSSPQRLPGVHRPPGGQRLQSSDAPSPQAGEVAHDRVSFEEVATADRCAARIKAPCALTASADLRAGRLSR